MKNSWKCCGLDFLAVHNFNFTRKIVKNFFDKKLVKILGFCQNEFLDKNLTIWTVCLHMLQIWIFGVKIQITFNSWQLHLCWFLARKFKITLLTDWSPESRWMEEKIKFERMLGNVRENSLFQADSSSPPSSQFSSPKSVSFLCGIVGCCHTVAAAELYEWNV